MNNSRYQESEIVLSESYWQNIARWVDDYLQRHVGTSSLMDGELTPRDEARLEAWAAEPNNAFHFVQALTSQPFYQEYLDSLPDYVPGEEIVVELDFDDIFGDIFEGQGELDDLFDDDAPSGEASDGPPYEPRLSQDQVEDMALLYQAALDRMPDEAGLNYFVSNMRDGQSLQDIARSFYQSDEFRSQFEQFDDTSYVNQLYLNVLGREADQAGLDYWVNDIQHNDRSHADVLVSFAQSDENSESAESWLAGMQFNSDADMWLM